MLNVLVGYDPNDPVTAWSVGNIEKDYTKFLKADGVKGKRIGVLRSFFGTRRSMTRSILLPIKRSRPKEVREGLKNWV